MSQTSPQLKAVCLDLGNGYTKLTIPDGDGNLKAVAIPSYVTPQSYDKLRTQRAESYHVEVDGKAYGVGERARPTDVSDSADESTHGLWRNHKYEYYRHFLLGLFGGYDRGVDHITIDTLYVTVQPGGAKDSLKGVKALKSGPIKAVYGNRAVTIKIGKVETVEETRATGYYIGETIKPDESFCVVNVGKGTQHLAFFDKYGEPSRATVTRTYGNGNRMEALRKLIRIDFSNMAPSCEALSLALESGLATVGLNQNAVSLKTYKTQFYKGQAQTMKPVEAGLKQMGIKTVYLVGGGSHCLSLWKPKDIEVIREIPGIEDPQLAEVIGLQLISEAA